MRGTPIDGAWNTLVYEHLDAMSLPSLRNKEMDYRSISSFVSEG
jgi:hypothetical protein